MKSTLSSYRPDIDGLRALAIVPVVGFHAFPAQVPGGFIGVDIFFVISGFLISSILLREFNEGRFSLAGFYARRIRRIFPALALVLASCLAVGWYTLNAEDYRLLGKHAVAGAAFVSNLILASESGYFDTAAELKPLLNLWSLGVEEQFYIVWPLLLWLAFRLRWSPWVILVPLGVVSFMAGVTTTATQPELAFFLPHTRFWELLAGAAMACLWQRLPVVDRGRGLWAQTCSAAGLLTVFIGLAVLTKAHPFPGAWALLPVTGAVLMIAGGPATFVGRWVLGNRLMVGIGLISYPLYLWHWPALVLLRITTPGEPPAIGIWLTVAMSVLLAWATYRFLELPLRRLPVGRVARLRVDPKVAAPALGVLAAAVVGLGVWRAGGYSYRVPADVVALTAARDGIEEQFRRGRCHLRSNQRPDAFQPECTTAGAPGKPVVMLWGDSHAGHLYAGLRDAARERGLTLIQHTFSGCPPLPGYSPATVPQCAANNDWVVQKIRRAPPDVLVIAGYWQSSPEYGDAQAKARRLLALQEELGPTGKPKVVVVGPVPEWEPTLPLVVLNLSRGGGLLIGEASVSKVPERTFKGVNLRVFDQDRVFKAAFAGSAIDYLSPVDVLCNDQGCLVWADRQASSLVAHDATHLTEAGSRLLVGASGDALLGGGDQLPGSGRSRTAGASTISWTRYPR